MVIFPMVFILNKISESSAVAGNAAAQEESAAAMTVDKSDLGPAVPAMSLEKIEDLEKESSSVQWSLPVHSNTLVDICVSSYEVAVSAGKFDDPLVLRFEHHALPNTFDKLWTSDNLSTWPPDTLVSMCRIVFQVIICL